VKRVRLDAGRVGSFYKRLVVGFFLEFKSGKTYREIETLDLKRWEVIPDADTKDTVATESAGKPKTAKRTNRKGK
jgi:hypothetical protein